MAINRWMRKCIVSWACRVGATAVNAVARKDFQGGSGCLPGSHFHRKARPPCRDGEMGLDGRPPRRICHRNGRLTGIADLRRWGRHRKVDRLTGYGIIHGAFPRGRTRKKFFRARGVFHVPAPPAHAAGPTPRTASPSSANCQLPICPVTSLWNRNLISGGGEVETSFEIVMEIRSIHGKKSEMSRLSVTGDGFVNLEGLFWSADRPGKTEKDFILDL